MIDANFRDQVVASLPRLRRFARALTRHAPDADDLVQLALERALARRAQWRPGTSVHTWLLAIVRNAWLDELRARKRRETVFVPADDATDVGDASTDRDIEWWSILEALDQLPDEQRLAVVLVLVEGLSYKEAAAVMAVPVGTLTSRLARGRLAMEAMLTEGAEARNANEANEANG